MRPIPECPVSFAAACTDAGLGFRPQLVDAEPNACFRIPGGGEALRPTRGVLGPRERGRQSPPDVSLAGESMGHVRTHPPAHVSGRTAPDRFDLRDRLV